ncbi:aspartic proteinase CDR1-like [Lolium rigidum]|uniref:aspartic proteinase CDR1-like n=1 Tax=Lolium rigidum TaxID=89674 RepID=UPI001F5C1466|nr:aspartic proteinase CDR1-like [Lolium rigidum]
MAGTTVSRALLLLVGVVLTAQLCGCTADVGRGDGFSVEFIHRDDVRSPYHDPSLTAHERLLAAVSRSTDRAAALSRSRVGGGAMSEVTSRPFEYLIAVRVGTPSTRMLAVADTGSDLVWLKCTDNTDPKRAPAPGKDVVFYPANSTTFGHVDCKSGACRALNGASCTPSNHCRYLYTYFDGSRTSGLLSTETFTFHDGVTRHRDEAASLRVANVNFGCSTQNAGTFPADGVVGLGGGALSLVTQLGNDASIGRKFSYCLVNFFLNASSALNFGARAHVTEPGAVTTPLVRSQVDTYYTVKLESVKIGKSTFQPHPHGSSLLIVDSGSSLTFLDKSVLDPLVEELTKRIKLPKAESREKLMCFDISGVPMGQVVAMVPDVTLELGGGAAVTLKPQNTFVMMHEGMMCMALAAASERNPVSILGNIAQQNMHIGYDLDKRILTFAPADCANSSPPSPH